MTKTTMGIIGIIVVVLIAVGWWSSRGPVVTAPVITNEAVNVTEPVTSTTSDASANVIQPVAVKISGSEFSYAPATISAKVGQEVTVTYTNTGKYPHNFVINELGVKSQTIKSGETATFSFTPNKTGTFSFYCSLPNHREQGMVGTISVN